MVCDLRTLMWPINTLQWDVRTWDVRTTDLWVHQLDPKTSEPVKSWNILQGQVPQVPAGAPVRVDVRLKNFGMASVNVQLVLQTVSVSSPDKRFGDVIYTGTQSLGAGVEGVFYHFVKMWAENVYQRLWVLNVDLPQVNCLAGAAPPWPGTCDQGELHDFLNSSRHLVYMTVTGAVPQWVWLVAAAGGLAAVGVVIAKARHH